MEVKAGYKKTEVGIIPDDWHAKPLTGLALILHGFGFQSQYFTSFGNFRLTTPGHFYEEGGFRDLGDKQKYYDGPLPSGYLLNEGDMIVAMTEQTDGLLGSAALVPISGTYLHNQRLGKVKILSPELSIKYLYLVFNSQGYRAKVRETAAGTKVKHTSPTKLLEISIPIPPTVAEQEAIAKALSDADALIEALEQVIAKKRQVKQGAMQDLLMGKRRLPGFEKKHGYKETEVGIIPEDWEVRPLLSAIQIAQGQVNPKIQPYKSMTLVGPAHVESGTGKLIARQTAEEQGAISGKYLFEAGDIVYGKINPYLQKAFLADFSGLCSADMYPLRPQKGVSPGFMLAVILGRQYTNYAISVSVRSGMPKINRDEMNGFAFPIPTDQAEQTAIAEILSDMDAEISALEEKLSKAREVKQGMMSVLLTGRVRLVES